MKTLIKYAAAVLSLALLGGCLEVDQHPVWINGKYAGKPDDRPYKVMFHNDRLAWWGANNNRNQYQNEYNRANP